jgi:hypothetical protein
MESMMREVGKVGRVVAMSVKDELRNSVGSNIYQSWIDCLKNPSALAMPGRQYSACKIRSSEEVTRIAMLNRHRTRYFEVRRVEEACFS